MKKLLLFLFLPSVSWGTALPHLAHSHVNGTVAPSSTYFIVPGQTVVAEFPTEAWAQIPFYSSGTISGMYIRLEDNSLTNASTFTLRVNGVSVGSKVVMQHAVLIGSDTIHADHINYGDKIDFMLQTGSGGTTMQPLAVYFLFTPDSAINYQRFSPASPNTGISITNGFQPYYSNITGDLGQNFFKEHAYHVMRTSGTFRNIAVYIISNTRTETIPFSLWKNGADTLLSVNVTAGATGLKENTTTQVSYVAGDTVTYEIGMNNGSDANPIVFSFISTEVISSGTAVEYAVGIDDKPQNAGETWSIPPFSALTFGGDEYEIPAYAPGRLNNFCMYTAQNNVSTISTLKYRLNGNTDPNIVMTIPSNSTGTFCDLTHSVTFMSTDTLAYLGNSPAGAGTLYYSSIMAAMNVRSPDDPLYSFKIFPANNIWNADITNAVVSDSNTNWMDGNNGHSFHDFHPDFGNSNLADGTYNGIPYNVAFSSTIPSYLKITTYATESDTQPVTGVPMAPDAIVEGDPLADSGSDRHLIIVASGTIYELFSTTRTLQKNWQAAQFSTFYSTSNVLRPNNFTSADAAGLPILPGLLRYEEVQAAIDNGTMTIPHALRFTLSLTHGPHIWPARHDADTGGAANPPFGMRVRMKASIDISSYGNVTKVIFNTLKKYGMFMADNGGDWFLSGAPDLRWDDSQLHTDFITVGVPHDIFQVINEQTWQVDPNSGQFLAPQIPLSPAFIQGSATINGQVTIK